MLEAATGIESGETKNGQRKHHWSHNGQAAPRYFMRARTPFNIGLQTLYARTPTLLKGARALMLNRAAAVTIRDWRRGKRKAPAWAKALLKEAIEKRIAELEHARAIL